MSIALPIISNILIAALLVLGFFVGRNNGWKRQLIKLFLVAGAAVGMYFLAPVVARSLLQIEFIADMITSLEVLYFTPIVYTLLTLLSYLLISAVLSIIFNCIKKSKNKVVTSKTKSAKVNIAKSIKLTKIEKQNNRRIAKENKKAAKLALRQQYTKKQKVGRIFGGIIGIVIAFVIGFIVFLPINALQNVAPIDSGLEKIYDTSLYGVVDFDLSDKLVENINNDFIGIED